jgi:hypothetical protein
MKRDLSKLTGVDIDRIRYWMYHPERKMRCPFEGHLKSYQKCRDIFPKLDTTDACPCDVSSVKYVTKVARQIIKDWEAENEISK